MFGYVESNFKAIVKPKQDARYYMLTLLPELEYLIALEELDIRDVLQGTNKFQKRVLIQSKYGEAWISYNDVSDIFNVIKIIRERFIDKNKLDSAIYNSKNMFPENTRDDDWYSFIND